MDNYSFMKMIKSPDLDEKTAYFYIYLKLNYRHASRMNEMKRGGELSTNAENDFHFHAFNRRDNEILNTKYNFYGYEYSYEECRKQYYLYEEQAEKFLLLQNNKNTDI
jgi:hypothetical protein